MSLASAPSDLSDLRDYAFEWALVDVETSGLVPRRDRVLSVAVVTLGPDGEQTGEFSTLLDPGCDPGPVHVHGLTAERLRGAPAFEQVAERIGALLEGRVLVAHNAQFDYDFLAHEFARARLRLPVNRRLCTLALNRRVDPPTDDLKLGTLAAHYGVPRLKAHDALDDTRVLAGVLRASLRAAAGLDLPLPLVACPPRQDPRFAPKPPKTPCAFRNPGRLTPGGPLVQGMKVAVTGETGSDRADLVLRGVAAGLNMMGSVSRHTSALVTNEPSGGSAKARRARAEGVPVIDESAFLRLLGDVRPGTRHEGAASALSPGLPAVPTPRGPAAGEAAGPKPGAKRSGKPRGPLTGRRVLVLGGTHPDAVAARTRVVELGGAAAINLSAGVTDVVVLDGGHGDRRLARITALLLPVHDAAWLVAPVVTEAAGAGEGRAAAHVLPRGGVVDLPLPKGRGPADRWTVTASWAQQTACEIDVVAFVLDEDEQVSFDEDFVFYGAPENPGGTVRLLSDGPTEQTVSVDLATLPPSARKVVVAAAIDGSPAFGDVGALHIVSGPGTSAAALAQATLDAATTERTMLLAEIYRRGESWRLRAVGQGYDHDLGALARGYGVDVTD
ncbi:DNA polymerase III [Streptomyces sp. KPB2]|uniref:TerD family protein n=1 Tax=unclassified Streptomyces TaxID=2593676 RepID=UPI000F6EF645|nr:MULTISPECIES: TerD family protein [unclassified Streptomyces]AZM73744.1 DNA polymerase III [Streptomyces sp. KPB2]MBH5133382.1 TerD family protein [Streptomyces sp. HB-N217]